jgi:uncharacterized protein
MITRRLALAGLFSLPLAPSLAPDFGLPWPQRLIRAARRQIGVTVSYDPAYVRLGFPMGDVDRATGVCSDVIIRAYRDAFVVDLQALINADMRAAFSAYPKTWGLSRPDKNIDHRRVPNIECYLERQNSAQATPAQLTDWQPGDLYTMRLGGRLPHIAVVSDRLADAGHPLVIHNIGGGTREEDLLGQHQNERRFRFAAPEVAPA